MSRQNVSVDCFWPLGGRTVDIDKSLAEDSGCAHQRNRVFAQIEGVLGVDLHRDFDRCLRFVVHDVNSGDIADVHACQTDRRAFAQALSVIEKRADGDLAGKPSSGAAHQENQEAERNTGDQDGESHAELRPFQLFLARQGGPLTTQHNSKRRGISGILTFRVKRVVGRAQ